MAPSPLSAANNARIDRLVAVFTRIGEERMKDLGLYNPALGVAALGFRPWQGWLAGILVTPWFMNFVMLPADGQLADATAGTKRKLDMPKGEVQFTIGEVEEIGLYAAHSLHSPMGHFTDQAAAVAAGWAAVDNFFRPADDQQAADCSFGWPEHAR